MPSVILRHTLQFCMISPLCGRPRRRTDRQKDIPVELFILLPEESLSISGISFKFPKANITCISWTRRDWKDMGLGIWDSLHPEPNMGSSSL